MSSADAPPDPPKDDAPKSIFLVSYPKIVYLYPTWIASLVAGILMAFAENQVTDNTNMLSMIFLTIFALNMVVLSFDFPRTTSLTLFFFSVALGVSMWALFRFNPNLWPAFTNLLHSIKPFCNSTYYFCFFSFMTLIYLAVLVSVQFDYWEIRPNELLHHHGFLSDMERFPAPQLRIEKEINDVFEYFLLRSGRLILHPAQERRAIVLDNVFFISRKERQIIHIISAMQVQVRTTNS